MKQERTLAEITRDAIRILNRELGPVETLCFPRQYTHGVGNYTEERHEWLDHYTVNDVDIELKRRKTTSLERAGHESRLFFMPYVKW